MNVSTETTTLLVQAVKTYAMAHYLDGGWDVIVECWEDDEIAEKIGDASTVRSALAAFSVLVGAWSEAQANAR